MAGRREQLTVATVTSDRNENLRPERERKGKKSPGNGRNRTGRIELPDDVLEIILSFLPMKKAKLVGSRSNRFKRSYLSNRYLDFGKKFSRGCRRDEYIRFTDRVLECHLSPKICRLQLFLKPNKEIARLENWIRFATKKEVLELDLDFIKEREVHDFSINLLDNNTSLQDFKLSSCVLHLPVYFNGFRWLKSLLLRKVKLREVDIQSLFANCGSLQVFDLRQCLGFKRFETPVMSEDLKRLNLVDCLNLVEVVLNATSLCSFHFFGPFTKISVSEDDDLKLNLRDVVFRFTSFREGGDVDHMRNLLSSFAHIDFLTVNSTFIEWLSPVSLHRKLNHVRFSFHNLKEFQLSMIETLYYNPLDVAFFLKHCPFLEKIFIDLGGFRYESPLYWDVHGKYEAQWIECMFHCLTFVKLEGFKLNKFGTYLVKLFLGGATALDTLVVVTAKSSNSNNDNSPLISASDILRDEHLSHLKIASPLAELVVYEHSKDATSIHPTGYKFSC